MLLRRSSLLLLAGLLQLLSSSTCILETIDTTQPILRQLQGLGEYDYFGYSLVLHQLQNNIGSRDQALAQTRIVVSAPNATASGAQVDNTGVVYTCPILPGECSPLLGDRQGADRRLYDTDGNAGDEDKSRQFLGASMASKGGRFMVCAHRHTFSNNGGLFPLGKCFVSNGPALSGFLELEPCRGTGALQTYSVGVCQAGTSAALTDDGALALGSPGFYTWRGIVIRQAPDGRIRFQPFGDGTERFGYQGYSMTTGNFLDTNREDFAVSVPRSQLYFGTVNIVMNSNALSVVSQPLRGDQMGEYYGFSVVAVDLTGDGLDELIVGAPMYRASGSEPETGRIFVYSNQGGSFSLLRCIEGRARNSRFGTAMVNLGDVSGDGFDDVAVSAPYEGSGVVYIFHSSSTLTLNPVPQQIIRGSDINDTLTVDLSDLQGFGTSLASNVDVDRNTYNDLVVGSFMSQQVFLLRTRPLAIVTTTLSAMPQIVNVDDTNTACSLIGGDRFACFVITTCVTYEGSGLSSTLDLTIEVTADRQSVMNGLEQRVFFDSAATTPSFSRQMETVSIDQMNCYDFTAYIMDEITDRFNAFIIEVDVQAPELQLQPGNGNETPEDFSGFPIVSNAGTTVIQVETEKNCGNNGECIPDLEIMHDSTIIMSNDGTQISKLTAGNTRNIEIDLDIVNNGLDAFQSRLSFSVPTRQLEVVRISNFSANLVLTCIEESLTVQGQELTRHNCSIGNPLPGGLGLIVRVDLQPRPEIIGNEGSITLEFSVDSVNPDPVGDRGDNMVLVTIEVDAQADVFLDEPGLVVPEQVSYSNVNPGSDIQNITQLGMGVQVSFVVRNTGPSTVPNVQLTIFWPLFVDMDMQTFYLYTGNAQTSGTGATVTCENVNLNQQNYLLPSNDQTEDQEGDPIGTPTGGGKRRRRRGAPTRKLRKRQAVETGTLSVERTVNCEDSSANCQPINCNIIGLQGPGSARVDISAYVDERFFADSVDRFVFMPTAQVSIVNGDFITKPSDAGPSRSTTSNAQVRVIPAAQVISVGERRPVPWWAIVVPIVVAIIFIVIVAVLLWVFGFFRRRKHEELKQRREELQNLNENAITPGESTDQLTDGSNL